MQLCKDRSRRWHQRISRLNQQSSSQAQLSQRLNDGSEKSANQTAYPWYTKCTLNLEDTVKVISGRDKGKIGEVARITKHNSNIVVKDINLKTKHVKSKEQKEQGQIIKIEAPIHISNVMLFSREENVVSRVGHNTLEDGKRVRYLIQTGEVIDIAENWKKVVKEKKESRELVAA